MKLTLEIIRQRKDKVDMLMKLVYAMEVNEVIGRGLDDTPYEENCTRLECAFDKKLTELQNTK